MNSNMSYCRFEHTHRDLDDCVDVVEEMLDRVEVQQVNSKLDGPLDARELKAAIDLAIRAQDLLEMIREAAGLNADEELSHADIEAVLTEANNDLPKEKK